LIAELMPIVLEHPAFHTHPWLTRFRWLGNLMKFAHKVAHWFHSAGPILAVAGLTLSLLHQASLGATYSVLAGRGIWFNQSAPVQFVFSAMSGGIALLFLTSVFIFRVMRPGQVTDEALKDVARLSGGITLLLTYLRIWDWAVTNYYSFNREIALQTEVLDKIAPYSLTFWVGQVLLPIIAGSIMMGAKKVNFRTLMAVSFFPIIAAVLTRWNYNFAGLIASITYDPFTPGVILNSYTPTWVEFSVGTLVICYWLLMFSLAARYLPFQSMKEHH